jgi:hypothetical protein
MTQKISVIYKAPEGDSKVTEAFGHTFFDGKAEDIEVSDRIAEKIKNNPVLNPGGKGAPKPHEQPHDQDGDKKHK